MANSAVLARGIDALKHNQEGAPVFREHQVLQFSKLFELLGQRLGGVLLGLVFPCVRWVKILEQDLGAGRDEHGWAESQASSFSAVSRSCRVTAGSGADRSSSRNPGRRRSRESRASTLRWVAWSRQQTRKNTSV